MESSPRQSVCICTTQKLFAINSNAPCCHCETLATAGGCVPHEEFIQIARLTRSGLNWVWVFETAQKLVEIGNCAHLARSTAREFVFIFVLILRCTRSSVRWNIVIISDENENYFAAAKTNRIVVYYIHLVRVRLLNSRIIYSNQLTRRGFRYSFRAEMAEPASNKF